MAILIDGYNLLHVTGVFCDAVGPGAVEKLHHALIDDLLSILHPAELRQLTVVFDAKGRKAGTRRSVMYRDVTIHYSARNEDADTLLRELIEQHPAPRQLVVVSSDHQVQRSARRRRAKSIDSQVWYSACRRRHTAPQFDPNARPPPPIEPIEFPADLGAAVIPETEPSDTHPFSPSYLAEIQQELLADKADTDRPLKGPSPGKRRTTPRPADGGDRC